jgi:hypothetical protein
MAKIPCRLIADLEASFKPVGGNPLLRFRHKVDGKKPFPKRQMGIMEDRASRYGELITALITIELVSLFYLGYLIRSAAGTLNSILPFEGFQVVATLIVIGIAFNETDQTNFHRIPP